jgi:large subunit ribosomal protein L17
MRHLKAGRKLGRNATHRLALYRNLALALFRHERIITTLEKAKAARPFIEKLITLAKKGDLHARRLAVARMGPVADAEVRPAEGKDEGDGRTIIQKLFSELGPRFQDRPGGYTRVIKRHERRLGDGGKTAFLELLKEGETRSRGRAPAPAPAPRVEEEPQEQHEETPPETGAAAAEGQSADKPQTGAETPPASA